MDIKNTNASQTTKTYNRDAIENQTENIYEAISIISKRAEQIKGDVKKELIEKPHRNLVFHKKGKLRKYL